MSTSPILFEKVTAWRTSSPTMATLWPLAAILWLFVTRISGMLCFLTVLGSLSLEQLL
ncbi:hypothetical protein LINPERPRIM_LOCUS2607 [Linum perenne]